MQYNMMTFRDSKLVLIDCPRNELKLTANWPSVLGMPDGRDGSSANKNIGHSVKYDFQINKYFLVSATFGAHLYF